MDKKIIVIAASVTLVFFAAAVTARPQATVTDTPLYTFRMEQASNNMHFLPATVNEFTYTTQKGFTVACDTTLYSGSITPQTVPQVYTIWVTCKTCGPTCDTCRRTCNTCYCTCEWPCRCTSEGATCDFITCDFTCAFTCDTCFDTCFDSCWITCNWNTCFNTCERTCLELTCEHTCYLTCEPTCHETFWPNCPTQGLTCHTCPVTCSTCQTCVYTCWTTCIPP